MGVSFLAPVFLAGLAALAVPVVIHLTHRARKQAVTFPSLMFVRRIPYRSVRRQRIRHWVLFLLRSLAIVLLALAFARPLLEGAGRAAGAFRSATDFIVLLDKSHSMAHGDRWERGLEAARRAVDALGPEDRMTLVAFAERADALTQPTSDAAILQTTLDTLSPGYAVTRYGPALQLAGELVARSELPRSELILVSDFQRAGWDPSRAPILPEGTAVTAVDVARGDEGNLAVASAAVSQDRSDGRWQVRVSARLLNLGPEGREDVGVSLELDGQTVQRRTMALESNGSATVAFDAVPLPRRSVAGVIRLEDEAVPGDNQYHFVVAPDESVSVLVIEPRNAPRDHSLFLLRALEIGERPRLQVRVRRAGEVQAADLEGRSLVILNDAPFPAGAAGRRVRQVVTAGGGLLAFLGRYTTPSSWPEGALSLLPGAFGSPLDRSDEGGGTLSSLNYDHPALQIFAEPRSGDFSAARFFRYRRLQQVDSATVLARFDDGNVALAEASLGDGSVVVLASDVENFWNDLAVQPVFLPFLHQLLRYMSSYTEPRYAFRVGQVIDLGASRPDVLGGALETGAELVTESPAGARQVRSPGEARYLAVSEAGLYRVRRLNDSDGDVLTIAVNVDPAESDLSRLDPQELVGAIAGGEASDAGTMTATMLSVEERERRQGLWWFLLLTAAAVLLVETVLSARASRRTR